MMMKLVFPAGDRPQMLLHEGSYRIGSAADSDVALAAIGIEPLHCELQVGAQGVQMRVPGGLRVLVNDRPVDGLIALRADDVLGLASTRIRLLDAAVPQAAEFYPAQRCHWYRVVRRSAIEDTTVNNTAYRRMVVTVESPVKSKTLVWAPGQPNAGEPVFTNVAFISTYVVNVFPVSFRME